ncbi:MAG: hypothetical protein HY737_08280 [Candidatus Omnitrophica bacterium]|nr:hypothetical protein [Candidatus Omnitrophota bacterium]
MAVEKINVTFPKETLAQLRRLIPPGERSHIIAEATAHYLADVTQKATLRQVAGLWKDRAQLRTQTDVNRELKRLRGSTARRLKRLGRRG